MQNVKKVAPSTSVSPTTETAYATMWAFHPTSKVTNGQFSWPNFWEAASEVNESSLKSECAVWLWWGSYRLIVRKSLTVRVCQSSKSCLLQNMRQAPLCSIKIHCKQLRKGATVLQVDTILIIMTNSKKKQVYASMAVAARPEIRNNFWEWHSILTGQRLKSGPANIVGNCLLCFYLTQQTSNWKGGTSWNNHKWKAWIIERYISTFVG